MRKAVSIPILGLLVCLLLPLAAPAKERILSFDSHIRVARDGTLEVREVIRVNAEGENIRRGIFRDFPTIYPGKDGRTITVGFVFVGATRDGRDEPWRIEAHDNGQRVWLGSKAVELSRGEHTYELSYRTDRQMGYFADHDELYWNVTGNGWAFDIERATATVELPDNIPRGEIQLEAYTGGSGERGGAYRAEIQGQNAFFTTTQALKDHQGLTIVASWPKNYILPGVEYPQPLSGPTQSPGYDFARDAGQGPSQAGWSPLEGFVGHKLRHDNGAFWYTLLGFIALIAYYLYTWNRLGRDPPGRVIIPEYQPPADQSPASMRYIMHMGYDDACFGAAVLSLAVKGYLRIQQDDGLLGFGKTFTLTRETTASKQPLNSDERALLDSLFTSGDSLVLKKQNYRAVAAARSAHSSSLKSQYSTPFFRINGGWLFLGVLISILVLLVAITLPGAGETWPSWHLQTPLGWATVALALAGIAANGVFAWLLKAPTARGQAAMDHIRGFKMYLEVAEGEELRRVTEPPPPMTPQLFESYLPAALALGVEQNWSERFARVLDVQAPNYHPAWYAGSGFDARHLGAFSSQLGSSLNSAISSSATAPGSSSGRGGGGSSGGGGGGGGGGGW